MGVGVLVGAGAVTGVFVGTGVGMGVFSGAGAVTDVFVGAGVGAAEVTTVGVSAKAGVSAGTGLAALDLVGVGVLIGTSVAVGWEVEAAATVGSSVGRGMGNAVELSSQAFIPTPTSSITETANQRIRCRENTIIYSYRPLIVNSRTVKTIFTNTVQTSPPVIPGRRGLTGVAWGRHTTSVTRLLGHSRKDKGEWQRAIFS